MLAEQKVRTIWEIFDINQSTENINVNIYFFLENTII